MSVTTAKKAELMLLYDTEGALKRLVEIIRIVVDTGEQPEMGAEVFGTNYYLRASLDGDFHYLYLEGTDGLYVTCNDMGGAPPWVGVANRGASFIFLWVLHDKELHEEAEVLCDISGS
jgi:hypothetical protein